MTGTERGKNDEPESKDIKEGITKREENEKPSVVGKQKRKKRNDGKIDKV